MLVEGMLPIFRDEEKEVLDLVEAYFAGKDPAEVVYTGIETPDEALEASLPFIRVGRVGGATARGAEHTDRPVVDVDVMASTRADAKRISLEVQALLLSRPHPIDKCTVLIGPQKVPWVEGIPIRRMFASYHLDLRR